MTAPLDMTAPLTATVRTQPAVPLHARRLSAYRQLLSL
jgi:hypothetical protein